MRVPSLPATGHAADWSNRHLGLSVDRIINWLALGLLVVVIVLGAVAIVRYWLGHRREQLMLRLLRGADTLEGDIKQCRVRLAQAHAAVTVTPGLPSAGSASAHDAIDKALRNLLEHRLWIRDRAPMASRDELQQAAEALESAGARIHQQLDQLQRAHQELDQAVREHQHRQ